MGGQPAPERWWDGRLLGECTEKLVGLAGERAAQRRVTGQMPSECPRALEGALEGGEYRDLLRRAEATGDPGSIQAWEGSFRAVRDALALLPEFGDEALPPQTEAHWDAALGDLEGHLEALSLPWRDELIERLEAEACLGSDI